MLRLRALLAVLALAPNACSEAPRRRDAGDGPGIHLLDARPDRRIAEAGDLMPPDLVLPGSDRCWGAAPIALVDGKASLTGSTEGASNEYGSGIRCGETSALVGPQRYFRLQLVQGMSYRVELKPTFAAALYLISSCGQSTINVDCGSGGATGALSLVPAGEVRSIHFAPPATGEYRLVVDSAAESARGSFQLGVEGFPQPANARCTEPTPLALQNGKVTVQGTTLGAVNENPGQIRCGLGVALDGPQVYYSVNLVIGAWFKLRLEPSFPATLYVANNAAGCKGPNLEVDCGGLTGTVLPGVPAGGVGEAVFSPYSTASYLIGVDSANPKAGGTFSLGIESVAPPAGMICALAIDLPLVGGTASVQGSTAGLQNDLGAHQSCSGQVSPQVGPQLYYKVALKQTAYELILKPSFAARLLVGQSCPTLPVDCASGGLTGVTLAVPAGTTGTKLFSAPAVGGYVIGVDSAALGEAGSFSLELREKVPPTNGSCAAPKTIALTQSPALEAANTGPLANDLAGVTCGSPLGPFAGPQAYHQLTLKAGKSYTIELEPEASFDPALYAFPAATPCMGSTVSAACQGLVSDTVGVGIKETLTLSPTVDTDYILVVDSWSPSEVGAFSLTVSWN